METIFGESTTHIAMEWHHVTILQSHPGIETMMNQQYIMTDVQAGSRVPAFVFSFITWWVVLGQMMHVRRANSTTN